MAACLVSFSLGSLPSEGTVAVQVCLCQQASFQRRCKQQAQSNSSVQFSAALSATVLYSERKTELCAFHLKISKFRFPSDFISAIQTLSFGTD